MGIVDGTHGKTTLTKKTNHVFFLFCSFCFFCGEISDLLLQGGGLFLFFTGKRKRQACCKGLAYACLFMRCIIFRYLIHPMKACRLSSDGVGLVCLPLWRVGRPLCPLEVWGRPIS